MGVLLKQNNNKEKTAFRDETKNTLHILIWRSPSQYWISKELLRCVCMRDMIHYCTFCCTFRRQHAVKETPLEYNPPPPSPCFNNDKRDLSPGHLPSHGCWQNGILSSRCSQLFSQNTCDGGAVTSSASGLCQEIRVIFHPRGHEESHQLGLACWWNNAEPSNLTGRERKGSSNRRTSIKANSLAAFHPNHQSDWCWDAIDPLQTFRLYLFYTPAKR